MAIEWNGWKLVDALASWRPLCTCMYTPHRCTHTHYQSTVGKYGRFSLQHGACCWCCSVRCDRERKASFSQAATGMERTKKAVTKIEWETPLTAATAAQMISLLQTQIHIERRSVWSVLRNTPTHTNTPAVCTMYIAVRFTLTYTQHGFEKRSINVRIKMWSLNEPEWRLDVHLCNLWNNFSTD